MQVRGRREQGQERALSVYVHVPYCLSKCPYCDFNSIRSSAPPEDRYAKALISEFQSEITKGWFSPFKNAPLKSLYFGGGTPTLFSPGAIGRVISACREVLSLAPETEITIEANPATIDSKRLALYKNAGVNRLSIGVQSFSAETLKTLGRAHGSEDAVRALEAAIDAGFDNIAADLIFAVPGQTLESFMEDIERLMGFKVRHVSVYGMTIEENTPFGMAFRAKTLKPVADETQAVMYEAAVKKLKANGFERYEISNFALPGKESIHNAGYWEGRDYLGLGAGAHSYAARPNVDKDVPFGGRKWNVDEPDEYMGLIETKGSATAGSEFLTKEEAMTEALSLGLRTSKGVDAASFKARFGIEPEEALTKAFSSCAGLIERTATGIRLTERGFLLANEVF